MEIGRLPRPLRLLKFNQIDGSSRLLVGSDPPMVLHLPGIKALRVLSRSIFFTFLLLVLPAFGYMTGGFSSPRISGSEPMSLELVETVFREVADGGLVAEDGSVLVVVSEEVTRTHIDFSNGGSNGVNFVKEADLRSLSSSSSDAVFVFMVPGATVLIVDRVLKVGSVVAFKLDNGGEALTSFMKFTNYRIVYVKTFESTIVAMKKMGHMERLFTSQRRRMGVCGRGVKVENQALKVTRGLEGALMEAPRKGMADNWNGGGHKSMRFVSELLGDEFGGYPRWVFVNMVVDGGRDDGLQWFQERYPRRGEVFDLYEVKMEKGSGGISEWLRGRVKEEEFVVVRAEAEVVEEMVNGGGICLVDELFMECGRKDVEVKSGKKKKKKVVMRRAYWECLALFGRLRDEGVAVHQWWPE